MYREFKCGCALYYHGRPYYSACPVHDEPTSFKENDNSLDADGDYYYYYCNETNAPRSLGGDAKSLVPCAAFAKLILAQATEVEQQEVYEWLHGLGRRIYK